MRFAVSLLVGASLVFGASCSADSTERTTITMPRLPYFTWAPITIADAEGFFDAEGIDMEYVDTNSSASMVPSLIAGDLDVWAGAPGYGLVNIIADGSAGIAVVAGKGELGRTDDGCSPSALVIGPDSAVEATADSVRGTTIGGMPGVLIHDYLVHTFLTDLGLEGDDVTEVVITAPSQPEAVMTGQVDIAFVSEPWLTRIPEGRILVHADDIVPDYQSGILVFGQRLLVDEPEVGDRFMRAYLAGLEQYNEGKTERNIEILAEATGQEPDELDRMCWTPMPADGSVRLDAVDEAIVWAASKDLVDQVIDQTQWWDPGPLERAKG